MKTVDLRAGARPRPRAPERGTRPWLASAVTAVVGLGLVAAWATGRAALFVRPWFLPVLVVGGAALVAVAWRAGLRISRAGAMVLLMPVIVGAALTPGLAGRIPPENGGGAVTARLGDTSRLLSGHGDHVTLLDIVLAERRVGAAFLDGRPVVVDGQVDGDRIARLVMVCCAADARPVTVPVTGASLPTDGGWVRVTGSLKAVNGGLAIDASDVTGIPTPEDPFL